VSSGPNWAGNHAFIAGRIHRPGSVDDVRRIVAATRHVHAVGARHAFNGAADSPGDLLDLSDIDPGYVIDPAARTVSLSANTSYAALAAHLQAHGWALHNMASLPHISLAGATATGTHGSGDALGTLATAIAGIELVTATGDLCLLYTSPSPRD
jgi:xylitol oxidase